MSSGNGHEFSRVQLTWALSLHLEPQFSLHSIIYLSSVKSLCGRYAIQKWGHSLPPCGKHLSWDILKLSWVGHCSGHRWQEDLKCQLIIFLFYFCYCVCLNKSCLSGCLGSTCVSGVHRDQQRALDPLELEFQMFVNCQVGAGSETQVLRKSSQVILT